MSSPKQQLQQSAKTDSLIAAHALPGYYQAISKDTITLLRVVKIYLSMLYRMQQDCCSS
jgi:hypothetical protein